MGATHHPNGIGRNYWFSQIIHPARISKLFPLHSATNSVVCQVQSLTELRSTTAEDSLCFGPSIFQAGVAKL